MRYCVVKGCGNSMYKEKKTGKHVALFAFPKNVEQRSKWVEALKTNQEEVIIKKNSTVCQEHFNKTNMYKFGLSPLRLHEGSVPSIFPNTSNLSITETTQCYGNNNASPKVLVENESISDSCQTQIENDMRCSTRTDTVIRTCKSYTRYPRNITTIKMANMSPSSLRNYITILRKRCNGQRIIIKRLKYQTYSQKKQIKSLKQCLNTLIET